MEDSTARDDLYATSPFVRDGQAVSPDWEDCQVCGRERIDELLPFPICACCALAIYDFIGTGMRLGPIPTRDSVRDRRNAELRRNAVVYYVRRANLIKIGTTGQFTSRMHALQPDEILAVEPGGVELESARHNQFKQFRVGRSDWFHDNPGLRQQIAAVVEEHGAPPSGRVF